ncbi:MAG: GNAT family N-acetyltransferase [Chitinophagaceae bacterium]|nr:GNAT family N-acetyltransferase [Chitinophagaceae bacterium]
MNNIEKIYLKETNNLEEMKESFSLIKQLTTSLTAKSYTSMLKKMVPFNYFQLQAYIDEQLVGVSGFWLQTKLYIGSYLEIDNFVVDTNFRSKGIGEKIILALIEISKNKNCKAIMLDAYLENTKAHNLYKKYGFKPEGYHFIKKIN